MTRDLGLLVVAEGMEDMESVRLLREMGTYAGQGFALSPALPADRMAQVLAGRPLDLDRITGPLPVVRSEPAGAGEGEAERGDIDVQLIEERSSGLR